MRRTRLLSRSSWPQRVKTILLWGGPSLLILVLLVAAVLYGLWRAEPAHWKAHRQFLRDTTPAQREQLAEALEKRLTQFQSRTAWSDRNNPPLRGVPAQSPVADPASPGGAPHNDPTHQPTSLNPAQMHGLGPRRLVLKTDEINSWLTERLPKYLANHNASLPAEISQPMVAIEGDQILIAFQYTSRRLTQVFSLSFRPSMVNVPGGDPRLKIELTKAAGGRLPLPRDVLDKLLKDAATASTQQAIESINALLRGQELDPVTTMPGDKQRQVRLLDFAIAPDGLSLDTRIDPTHPPRK